MRWKLLGALVMALGFVFLAWGYIAIHGVIHDVLPDSTSDTTRDLISGGLFGAAYLLLLGWARFILSLGRRMVRRGSNYSADGPSPVLYLRSFLADEKKPGLGGAPASSFEERFVTVLSKLGPVVAIGEPNETLPPLGAHRIYAGDADWHEVVLGLMKRAICVVLRAGATPGLRLEAEMLVHNVDPGRVILATGTVSEPQYGGFASRVGHLFPHGLPPTRGDTLWLTFGSDWSPQPVALAKWKRFLGQTMSSYSGIRESLRPFCAHLGIDLGRGETRLAALLSPLMILLFVGIGGFALWSSWEPVLHDVRVALREPLVQSEKGTFSVTLPSGWGRMSLGTGELPPEPPEVDRLVVSHIKLGPNGFGVFARIERMSLGASLDQLTQAMQQEFEEEGATTVQAPVARSVGAWEAREFKVLGPNLAYLVVVIDAGGNVYYYVSCWSQPEFIDRQIEVYKVAEAIKPVP